MLIKPFVNKILITLEVEDKTSILILLTKEGNINRKGDGSLNNLNLPLAQGISHDGHFEALLLTVSEDIFNHAGVLNYPDKKGKICQLTLIFQGANELDFSFRVKYGEDSQGPPVELAQILINAVKITEPWYQSQLVPVAEESKWWEFWK
jgi:hypothetical protein